MHMIERPDTGLLHFLQSAPKPAGRDFRTNPRHDSSATVELSWTDGRKALNAHGQLINLSRLGVALVVPGPPPITRKLLLRLEGENATPWMEAEVLGIDSYERRKFRLRLRFTDPCPTVFLKAAVLDPLPSS
ncbi:MAG: PilZ domain-containing protein [Isosphaeraceae bacterium]|nr:PilZ domain-containing protein [Isosphaeraceae bacterium]